MHPQDLADLELSKRCLRRHECHRAHQVRDIDGIRYLICILSHGNSLLGSRRCRLHLYRIGLGASFRRCLVVGLPDDRHEAVPSFAVETELEAVAGNRMVVVPLDRGIGDRKQLLVGLDRRQELPALRDVVAEEAAEREVVDRLVVPGGDRALLRALAAGDALRVVDDDLLPVIRDGLGLADLGAKGSVGFFSQEDCKYSGFMSLIKRLFSEKMTCPYLYLMLAQERKTLCFARVSAT